MRVYSRLALGHSLGIRAGFASAWLALGCGEITDNPSLAQGGRAGSAMGAGAAGSSGSSGSGGMSMGGTSNEEQDAGPETGSGNGGSFMYPEGCPEPSPIASPDAVDPQTIVIQSINFRTSEVVIRNISSRPQTLVGGEMGWQWCNFPNYNSIALSDVTLPPGGTLAFRLVNQFSIFPLFDGEPGDPNEMAIYTTTGSFMSAELMTSFVSWGAGLAGGRESVAVMAGLWTATDRVEIAPGHAGFIITGRADEGAGYTSVPLRCLVAPPNPPGTVLPMP